jgi:DNA-binding NtrC family response regulator
MKPLSILVIDDDLGILDIVATLLRREGHQVTAAPDGTCAADALERGPFDLVITDVLFPGQHRIEAIMDLIRRHSKTRVIAMSGGGPYPPAYYLRLVKTFGANAMLAKPFSNDQLLAAVAEVCG